jgi:CheY-like chemotaxis protein
MIRQLRKRPGFESVPIMAITAYGNGVAKEALEAGADRAATKPVQFNALAVEIRELLFRSQLQGRPEPQAPAE